MNEENPTGLQETEPVTQYEELSKAEAMAGVFTAPGETFEAIAGAPRKNYWILPVLICVVVGLISAFLFMQDNELATKTMDKQKKKMREKFEQSVKEGKMSQEDVEKTMDTMNPKGTMFKIFGFGGAVIGPFLILFILGLIYLVILKIMKSPVDFVNILNVVGLAMLITAVGSLLSVVASILKGDTTSIGLGLVLGESAVGEKVYALISKFDVFSIWFYVVISIGLSKVAKIDMIKSASIAFGLFLFYAIVTSLVF
ncbi:MAG: Yip1 family protein [Ignavibacteria bacterium]